MLCKNVNKLYYNKNSKRSLKKVLLLGGHHHPLMKSVFSQDQPELVSAPLFLWELHLLAQEEHTCRKVQVLNCKLGGISFFFSEKVQGTV